VAQLPSRRQEVDVTHGTTLRIILTGAIMAMLAMVPVAHAKQSVTSADGSYVCNQATHTSVVDGSDIVATDGVESRAARFQTSLKAKPGHGAGLLIAAAKSPALSACSAPDQPETPTDIGWEEGAAN
jgi:hypothetical protein